MAHKPLWKRLGARVRRGGHRLLTVAEHITRRHGDELLPPAHLRIYYYGTARPAAFRQHCDRMKTEVMAHGLHPGHRVLDIGSGIGNLAISLAGWLRGGYDGVEIHPEAVAWCQRAISTRHPQFRFHRADLASCAYNPRGATPAAEYQFPFADRSFDFVFLASVFTHMLPDAVERYLQEISRVLAPGGVAVASYFLLNDETRPAVERGRGFMSFDVAHESGLCLLHDAAVPEAAVALEEQFVRRTHEQAGLRIRAIRRGGWWTGEVHDQDVLEAEGV